MNSALKYALEYFDLGLNVFPLAPGTKKPLVEWKEEFHLRENKVSREQVEKWFTEYPSANVAIVCGSVSCNLVVLDFENFQDYTTLFPAYKKLEENTIVARTAHSGIHVYMRSMKPSRRSIRVVSDPHPIDVCGEGGYVVAPPSVIDHNFCPKDKCQRNDQSIYEELHENIARIMETNDDITDFLLRKATELKWSTNERATSNFRDVLQNGAGLGERNNDAFAIARFLLFTMRFESDLAFDILKHWNDRSRPPLDETELKAVFASAARYPRNDVESGSAAIAEVLS